MKSLAISKLQAKNNKGTKMNFFNNLMKYKADVFDIAFTKIAVFAGALFIAKVWDTVLGLDWYWYLLIFIIASIKPMVNFFKVMKRSEN